MRVVNCVPIIQTGSVTVMTKDIGSAFRSLGADVREMRYRPGQNAPEILPDLTSWLAESRDGGILVDVNGAIVTSNPGARAIENHADCFDSFSFLTDTPLNFPSRLENWPLGGMVGLVDASFFDLARFMKYQRPSFLFHPHGGPPTPPYVPDTKDRDIEFLFIGNIAKVDDATSHAASLYKNDPVLIELFLSSFENVTPDKTPFQITLSTALTGPATYRRKDVALVAVHLELYLSNVSRQRILASLEGLGVTIVGTVAEGALGPTADATVLGFHPFEACLDLVSRAKILINVVPSFPNGAHERLFYALSRGAAVMTTQSTFLENDCRSHGFVEFFDIENMDIREKTIHLLRDLDRGMVDRESMLRHYLEHHTWKQRLEPVLTQARKRVA